MPNVPRWTSALSLDYWTPLDGVGRDGALDARFDWQYSGEREADIGNTFTLDSYSVFNTRVGLSLEALSVYAFARNLTDERFETLGVRFGPTVEAVSVGRGRVVGVGASIRF